MKYNSLAEAYSVIQEGMAVMPAPSSIGTQLGSQMGNQNVDINALNKKMDDILGFVQQIYQQLGLIKSPTAPTQSTAQTTPTNTGAKYNTGR